MQATGSLLTSLIELNDWTNYWTTGCRIERLKWPLQGWMDGLRWPNFLWGRSFLSFLLPELYLFPELLLLSSASSQTYKYSLWATSSVPIVFLAIPVLWPFVSVYSTLVHSSSLRVTAFQTIKHVFPAFGADSNYFSSEDLPLGPSLRKALEHI